MEIWKPVKNFEGYYEVSNLGRVKGLERIVLKGGKNNFLKKELILKPSITSKYLAVSLLKNRIRKTKRIHQLVAESFLNHTPNYHKLVVNHIDSNRLNNHIDNLEIVTPRVNISKRVYNKTSKYVGVHYSSNSKKWIANIFINKKGNYLGIFKTEEEASNAYINKLNSL